MNTSPATIALLPEDRQARILMGNAFQLVLSGGGARGLAQIGVLRALEQAGFRPDLVGGSSMGAVLGALVAMGLRAEEIHAELRRHLIGTRSMTDLTWPRQSLFAGRRGARALELLCGGREIEDLPIGYFAVAADLVSAELVRMDRGPLAHAVIASVSIPGVFPPVPSGERLLVDGGVLDPLPIGVMADLAPGRIVAIDTTEKRPLPARKPGLLDIVRRAAELATLERRARVQRETAVALTIAPPVDAFGLLEFRSIDAIVEAGYRFASERVEDWMEILRAPTPNTERRCA